VDWDVDECAQPYERLAVPKAKTQPAAPRKPLNPMANRFQLLNIED